MCGLLADSTVASSATSWVLRSQTEIMEMYVSSPSYPVVQPGHFADTEKISQRELSLLFLTSPPDETSVITNSTKSICCRAATLQLMKR